MKRRIYGLETEFGIIWTPDVAHRKTLTVQNVVMYLFREIVAGRMYPDVFLENGARFYQDIGCHPEYATPECDDVAELVAHDKAGERIITRLASTAERRMRNDGFYGKISIFKNNLDTPGKYLWMPRKLPNGTACRFPSISIATYSVLCHASGIRRCRKNQAEPSRLLCHLTT